MITVVTVGLLAGCGGGGGSSISGISDGGSTPDIGTKDPKFYSKEKLGESLFFDQNLSLNRKTSCATCHDPDHAFIDARFTKSAVDQTVFIHGAFSVGDDGSALGGRNTPTAAYALFNPTFGKNSKGVYVGGQFHDGRATTLQDQATRPPLDGAEMMMPDEQSVIERIEENPDYVASFKLLYGTDIFDDIDASYQAMGEAIAKFEKTDEFAPFDSKYDRFKQCREGGGRTSECLQKDNWTVDEDLGMSLFFSEANTNCATCHTINSKSEAPSKELFTNFEYENIGTPRNIAAMDTRAALGLQDANATFKGLGGFVNESAHLGKGKVPTLRNVAVTGPYMNNGVFKNLKTVLEFYDHIHGQGNHPINPETGLAWGHNDHNATINHAVLRTGLELDDRAIEALEAFLKTLTDKRYEHLIK
ncbi:MAG: methylamine utilization protein MauG [Sulfurovum sp.]|nr:MAG: methylamine utilization protein MauG [Sulfurovum sp.]